MNRRFVAQQSAPGVSRRRFLKVVGLSGAGFMIGSLASEYAGALDQTAAMDAGVSGDSVTDLGPFIRIGADDTVTVIIKHLDKGQGVTTGLPTIVAEELDADWAQMRAEFAPADASRYNNLFFGPVQGTGGSTSVANSWEQLRQAAAGARAMLVGAAAARWGVLPAEITVRSGVVRHEGSGSEARFGDLAAEAVGVKPPAAPVLKQPEAFTLIGKHLPRLDSPAKTDGSAEFTIDVQRPGMLTAVVAHPPKFGARVASFDGTAARKVAGVLEVVEIPRGVAVVAGDFWSAKKGRDALIVRWDESGAEQRSSDALMKLLESSFEQPVLNARNDGDVDQALASADRVLKKRYRFPYLAHAAMETMDCVVELSDGRCDIWTGSQMPTVDQGLAAAISGLEPSQVYIHTRFAGGSFGRRAVPNSDYLVEAVMIAKAMAGQAPLKLIWTREDDMQAGFYRPMSYHELEGALDAEGRITAWRHRAVVQSLLIGTSFEVFVEDGLDETAVEGARDLPYAIPNLRVDWQPVETGVPVLWWRSVGHTQNGFVTEAFLDELAEAAGKDPLQLRRELLEDHPRHRAVLELAAEKAGWNSNPGPGRGRGIAVHESFGSFVAEVVEVTVLDGGRFTVDRVVCAVDCGIAVNPDVIRAQMEGGIGYGLSAALREEITLDNGVVAEQNFDRYRPLRINEMPAIEVHIVASAEAPTGVGEPGTPPVAPALANALHAATGRRITRLPIGDTVQV